MNENLLYALEIVEGSYSSQIFSIEHAGIINLCCFCAENRMLSYWLNILVELCLLSFSYVFDGKQDKTS